MHSLLHYPSSNRMCCSYIRRLPCSATLDAPLTVLNSSPASHLTEHSTLNKSPTPGWQLLCVDDFGRILLAGWYLHTSPHDREGAPEEEGKREDSEGKKMGTRPWCRTDRTYGMESRICAMMEAQTERFQGYTTAIFHGCLSMCVWWACVGVLKLLNIFANRIHTPNLHVLTGNEGVNYTSP